MERQGEGEQRGEEVRSHQQILQPQFADDGVWQQWLQ